MGNAEEMGTVEKEEMEQNERLAAARKMSELAQIWRALVDTAGTAEEVELVLELAAREGDAIRRVVAARVAWRQMNDMRELLHNRAREKEQD